MGARALLLQTLVPTLLVMPLQASPQELVITEAKLDDPALGGGVLSLLDVFGGSVASLGDLDGDGVPELAVGATGDDGGGLDRGAVYILFLDKDGVVLAWNRIADDAAGDPLDVLTLGNSSRFGSDLAFLGDYDGDGLLELAVGAFQAGGMGTVWVLDIDPSDGSLDGAFEIASGDPGFTTLDPGDRFGSGVANLSDWDGDGAPELGVGAISDGDGGTDNGAVYVLYLDPSPAATSVRSFAKISDTAGGFTGGFDPPTFFGSSLDSPGDLDGDGQPDVVVGAPLRGVSGSAWVLFLDPGCATLTVTPPNTNCVVKPAPTGFVEITDGSGGFAGSLDANVDFGSAIAWVPDSGAVSEDRLAVGASRHDSARGSVWMLTLASDGTVTSEERIASAESWPVVLGTNDNFGIAVDALGDWNGDGGNDLAVGARGDDGAVLNTGAAYLLALRLPEPGSGTLLLPGAGLVALLARRRRRSPPAP